jgi:hypothetical protein
MICLDQLPCGRDGGTGPRRDFVSFGKYARYRRGSRVSSASPATGRGRQPGFGKVLPSPHLKMTTGERLRSWHQAGLISDDQLATLDALASGRRFSLYVELNAFLYLGVLAFVGGMAWTFQTYFTDLGDPFILATFSTLFGGCLYYCFSRAAPYSHAEVDSPSLGFDYVLYLGCLLLSAELAYVEFRFHLFRGVWDHYLLFTTAVYALLAYRFDNRFVLSLALASCAGWFGLKMSAFDFRSADALRSSALIYGTLVAAAGTAVHRQGIKPHFLDTYLHVAANVVFWAMVSGIGDRSGSWLYLAALLALSTVAVVQGVRFRRFVFVAYGAVYGYIGVSVKVVPRFGNDATQILAYFVVTATLMIAALVMLARRFGRDE